MTTVLRTPASITAACNRALATKSASRRRPLTASFSSAPVASGGGEPKMQLVLYTKQGCCLCEGLKEKLDVAFSLAGPYSLHNVHLQTRDIAANPEWERLYQYEIPVLSRVRPDGTEETLPRLSPRLKPEIIQKKIAAAFED